MNTVKSREHISEAYKNYNIRDFALDKKAEIQKIIEATKNAKDLVDVVRYIPSDRLLVETDSPYLAPVPNRGKRNEPSNTKFTLKKLAEIKNTSVENMAKITTDNFFSLFNGI